MYFWILVAETAAPSTDASSNWFCQKLGRDETKAVPEEAIQEERDDGMPEPMIQQEFYCSFDAPLVGAYWGDLLSKMMEEKRVLSVSELTRLIRAALEDNFYEINLVTGAKKIIAAPDDVSATGLQISADNSTLYFVNNMSGNLEEVSIR